MPPPPQRREDSRGLSYGGGTDEPPKGKGESSFKGSSDAQRGAPVDSEWEGDFDAMRAEWDLLYRTGAV